MLQSTFSQDNYDKNDLPPIFLHGKLGGLVFFVVICIRTAAAHARDLHLTLPNS